MHIPTKSVNLKDQTITQFRLGIQGAPGSGKTTSAMTFPNPVVANFDAGLAAWTGKDVITIPFYDEEFVTSVLGFKPSKPGARANRKDAFPKWLREEGLKLTPEQTLIIDSWSSVQDAFDEEQALHPKISKTGEIDSYDFWAKKVDYSQELMNLICSMKCHVVVTFHELQSRDPATGRLLDKVQPLMQGKFVAELKRFYSLFFRMKTEEKKDNQGRVIGCNYFWQVKSSNDFDAKNAACGFPDDVFMIEPSYNSLLKYPKK